MHMGSCSLSLGQHCRCAIILVPSCKVPDCARKARLQCITAVAEVRWGLDRPVCLTMCLVYHADVREMCMSMSSNIKP